MHCPSRSFSFVRAATLLFGAAAVLVMATFSPETDAREPRAIGLGDSPPIATPTVPTSTPTTIKIAVSPIAGYVQKSKTGLPEGFSVELVRFVAADIGRTPVFVWTENVEQTLRAVQERKVDVGVGAISVTAGRELRVDFSHAYATSGLGMVVRSKPASWWSRLTTVMTKGRLSIILGFFLLIIVAGHLVWLAERGRDAFADAYFPGVFEGMYWAIVTASTVGYGDKAPVKWAGRALAGLVIVISLPMFAIFTAELTSALTAGEIQAQLSHPNDLGNRPVAVVAGTTSAAFASKRGLHVVAKKSVEEAVDAVQQGSADAAIYDEVPLRAVLRSRAKDKVAVQLIPQTFDPTPIAWALAENTPLLEQINLALLRRVESGDVGGLQATWLSAASK